jgi:hypothetical protein
MCVLVDSRGAPRTDVTTRPAQASNAPGCQPAAQRHARLGPMRSNRNWPRAAPAGEVAETGKRDGLARGPSGRARFGCSRGNPRPEVRRKLRSSGCLALAGSDAAAVRMQPAGSAARQQWAENYRFRAAVGRTAVRMQHEYR